MTTKNSTTKKVTEAIETAEAAERRRIQELGRGMREAGRHVWLAGLGAIGTVDQESRGLFADLVARGQRLEDRERPAIEKRFRSVGERVDGFRRDVEKGVEERVSNTLQRFGVPGRDEVHQLIERVEALTRQVEGLTAGAKS